MFRYETSKIIFILILLITKDMQIIALKDISYEFKNRFKKYKNNVGRPDEFYPINKRELNYYRLKQDLLKHQKLYKFNNLNEDSEDFNNLNEDAKESNTNFALKNPNYDLNYPDFITSKLSDYSNQIKRREISTNCAHADTLQNSSLYPSVLTKALEISFNSSVPSTGTGASLFSNVAQKMNTSPLDLAKMITKTGNSNNDDQFAKLIENFKRSKEISNQRTMSSQYMPKNVQSKSQQVQENEQDVNDDSRDISSSNLATILDHVLSKLESIEKAKSDEEEEHPNGVPCDILGSWSSTTLGFCFDIQTHKEKHHYISPAEINNKILSINVSECIPPKNHKIIDLEWKFTGSAIKPWGGPFYLYGQKKSENIIATFLGFCRTCEGIDTIFGSWNILSPTKDCNDISLGNEVKQDILRRVRMEIKRKERFKDLLYQSRYGKL